MIFNEQTALQIIQRFGLAATTLNVWKTRGAIPDKYFTKSGEIKKELDEPANKHEVQRFRAILEGGKLNLAAFTIDRNRLSDIQRGKAAVRKSEYLQFKKEVLQLKNKLRAVVEAKGFDTKVSAARKIREDTRLHWYLCFQQEILDELQKGLEPDVEDVEQFQIDCALLNQELNI